MDKYPAAEDSRARSSQFTLEAASLIDPKEEVVAELLLAMDSMTIEV